MAQSSEEYSTTIGPDAVFKGGELRFDKTLRLLGKLEGQIVSEGDLMIGQGARLTGDAKVGTLRLDGEVKGNLTANSKVHLSSTARLEGDLQTAKLEVAEGAVLVGRCVIGVNGKADIAAASAKSSPSASEPAPAASGGGSKPKPEEARRR
jgi:cytoskeletal protein CcmA (bactofilin family)